MDANKNGEIDVLDVNYIINQILNAKEEGMFVRERRHDIMKNRNTEVL
jgi:hypothetical protein